MSRSRKWGGEGGGVGRVCMCLNPPSRLHQTRTARLHQTRTARLQIIGLDLLSLPFPPACKQKYTPNPPWNIFLIRSCNSRCLFGFKKIRPKKIYEIRWFEYNVIKINAAFVCFFNTYCLSKVLGAHIVFQWLILLMLCIMVMHV